MYSRVLFANSHITNSTSDTRHTAIRSCNVLHVTSKTCITLCWTCTLRRVCWYKVYWETFMIMNSCNRVNLIKAAVIKKIAIVLLFQNWVNTVWYIEELINESLSWETFSNYDEPSEELYSYFQNYLYSGVRRWFWVCVCVCRGWRIVISHQACKQARALGVGHACSDINSVGTLMRIRNKVDKKQIKLLML